MERSTIDEGDDLRWLFSSDMSSESDDDIISVTAKQVRKKGRPSIVEKHPGIIQIVTEYIEQNTAGAHLRRRNDTLYTNGVTLKQIAEYVKTKLQIEVSKHTIARLLHPPQKNTVAGRRYKMFVAARVPPKRNESVRVTHDDFHFTAAQVSLVNQLGQLCAANTLLLSVDNKNKVDVGTPATSRRANIRTFHIIGQGPNYNDHDFPFSNAKIIPEGFQIRVSRISRSRSLSPPPAVPYRFLLRQKRSLSEDSGMKARKKLIGKARLRKTKSAGQKWTGLVLDNYTCSYTPVE